MVFSSLFICFLELYVCSQNLLFICFNEKKIHISLFVKETLDLSKWNQKKGLGIRPVVIMKYSIGAMLVLK